MPLFRVTCQITPPRVLPVLLLAAMVPAAAAPFNSRGLIDATIPWERRESFPAVVVDPDYARETRRKWGHLVDATSNDRM